MVILLVYTDSIKNYGNVHKSNFTLILTIYSFMKIKRASPDKQFLGWSKQEP